MPLSKLREWRAWSHAAAALSGLHFHNNCDSTDLGQLIASIQRVEAAIGQDLRRFQWLNIGGGYTYDGGRIGALCRELGRLADVYDIQVVMEPGAALVRTAGYFVSSVVDICEGAEWPIAILDLTVNHWPEVFEYQFEPDVLGHVEDAAHTYMLAGCSCLAGDLFGVYSFEHPLTVGARVVLLNAGAYSLVKAHMFNGINLPDIYAVAENGRVVLKRAFSFEDFASRWGVETRDCD